MDSILILVFGSYLVPNSIETMSEIYQSESTVCEVKIGNNGQYLAGKTLKFKGHSCNEVAKEVDKMVTLYPSGDYDFSSYANIK